jgi:endonuclease YncB( thermonuclease family)
MAVVLLSNLVFNKRLLCDVVAGEKETVLNRCLSGRIDVSREILVRGLGRVDEGNPLMQHQIEAQKAAAGLWRNPACQLDFDHC